MVENLPLPDLTKAEFDILRIIWKSQIFLSGVKNGHHTDVKISP